MGYKYYFNLRSFLIVYKTPFISLSIRSLQDLYFFVLRPGFNALDCR